MKTAVGQDFSDQIHKHLGSLVTGTKDLAFGNPPAAREDLGAGLSSFIAHRFQVLAGALKVDEPEIFTNDLFWARGYLASRNYPAGLFEALISSIKTVLAGFSPLVLDGALAPYFAKVDSMDLGQDSEPRGRIEANHRAALFLNLLLEGNRNGARDMVFHTLHEGMGIKEIYLQIFQVSLREIGRLWFLNQISVGQEHYATAVTQSILAELYPKVFSGKKNGRSVVVACSPGESHELGARMVADFFEMSGWNSIYLGADSPGADIVGMAEKVGAPVVALSVSTPIQMQNLFEVVHLCHDRNSKIPIMVGGYLFHLHPNLVVKSGADLYAGDADGAVKAAEIFL